MFAYLFVIILFNFIFWCFSTNLIARVDKLESGNLEINKCKIIKENWVEINYVHISIATQLN